MVLKQVAKPDPANDSGRWETIRAALEHRQLPTAR